jgi:hypothetical protein
MLRSKSTRTGHAPTSGKESLAWNEHESELHRKAPSDATRLLLQRGQTSNDATLEISTKLMIVPLILTVVGVYAGMLS